MGTEWDKEVVGKVDPQKRVLCLAQGFLSPARPRAWGQAVALAGGAPGGLQEGARRPPVSIEGPLEYGPQ